MLRSLFPLFLLCSVFWKLLWCCGTVMAEICTLTVLWVQVLEVHGNVERYSGEHLLEKSQAHLVDLPCYCSCKQWEGENN